MSNNNAVSDAFDPSHATTWPPRKGARRRKLDAIGRGEERLISQAAHIRLKKRKKKETK